VFEGDGKKIVSAALKAKPQGLDLQDRGHRSQGSGHKTLASRPRRDLEDYITGLTLVVFVGHKTLASRPRRDLEDYITGFNIGSVCRS